MSSRNASVSTSSQLPAAARNASQSSFDLLDERDEEIGLKATSSPSPFSITIDSPSLRTRSMMPARSWENSSNEIRFDTSVIASPPVNETLYHAEQGVVTKRHLSSV